MDINRFRSYFSCRIINSFSGIFKWNITKLKPVVLAPRSWRPRPTMVGEIIQETQTFCYFYIRIIHVPKFEGDRKDVQQILSILFTQSIRQHIKDLSGIKGYKVWLYFVVLEIMSPKIRWIEKLYHTKNCCKKIFIKCLHLTLPLTWANKQSISN